MRLKLSSRMKVAPSARIAVRRLRHSSSLSPSAMASAGRPVATTEMTVASKVLPVPSTGASSRCSGVGPSMSCRTNGNSRAARACALLASSRKGKSPRRSTSRRSRACCTSAGDGCAGMSGKTDWDKLHPAIKDLFVDLRFPGDYTPASHKLL
jgi:hypothetical protein